MNIEIKHHTIILLVGPSGCGKTYFAQNTLIPQLKEKTNCNIQYISSDNIRKELLGVDENYDKYALNMLSSSKEAFDLLYKKVSCVTKFPINAEFVIVDTKGVNEFFRNRIIQIAKNHHYGVNVIMFNYDNYSDYFDDKSLSGAINKSIRKDITKIKSSIRQSLRHQKIQEISTIKKKDFSNIIIDVPNIQLYEKCFVDNDRELLIISDVHGCYDEFVKLLNKNDIVVKNHKIISNKFNKLIILAGDYVDKGPKILDMIYFCHENINDIKIIIGNHENRLYKEINKNLKSLNSEWFNTFELLSDNDKIMFSSVFEQSIPFIKNDNVIITHAPCRIEYLGKIDSKSCIAQRSFVREMNDERKIYDMLNDDLNFYKYDLCYIKHVFGHIQIDNPCNTILSRTCIDGGCASGGKLYGLSINSLGKYFTSSVESSIKTNDILPSLKYDYVNNQKIEFSYRDKIKVNNFIENKVNFLSGTMSPCDKMDGELEDIHSAIKYFQSLDINQVVIEPKYMGSRCNVYLGKTDEESYAISRKGFIVNDRVDLTNVYHQLRNQLSDKFDLSEISYIIFDGELLPWSILGEGLINTFKNVYYNIEHENEFLKKTNFESKFNELIKNSDTDEFNKDICTLSKKDMIEKYGNYQYQVFKALLNYKSHIDVEEKEKLNQIYKRQLDLYGRNGEVYYKPFSILKIVYNNGREYSFYLDKSSTMTNHAMFNMINDDGCNIYDLSDENSVQRCIKQFNEYTIQEHYEGVVMKPNDIHANCVPYLKIRNREYLTMSYGYDYLNEYKYNKLYHRKGIHNKLKLSMKEWEFALQMLSIKRSDINKDNKQYIYLCSKFMDLQNNEESLDPRL